MTNVPDQEKTPRRTVRVSEELWARALAVAALNHETASDVVRRALEQYVKDQGES